MFLTHLHLTLEILFGKSYKMFRQVYKPFKASFPLSSPESCTLPAIKECETQWPVASLKLITSET